MPAPAPSRSRLAAGLAWTLLLLMLLPCAWSAAWGADESTLLWEATRLAQGGTIYRDFVTFLPPGAAAALAALYRLTGPTLLAAHALAAGLAVLIAWLLSRMARWQGLPAAAAVVPGLLYVALLFWPNPTYSHHGLALALGLAALVAAMRAVEAAGAGWWARAGCLAGLALVTTQPDGALALASLGGGLVYAGWTRACARPWRAGLAVAGGALVPPLLTAGWLAWRGVLDEAWRQAVRWPLVHYKVPGGFNDVAWLTDLPGLLSPATPDFHGLWHWYAHAALVLTPYGLLAGGPLAALVAGLPGLVRREANSADARLAFVAAMAWGSLAICLRGRADYLHTVAYATPALVLAAVWAWRRLAGVAGWQLAGALPAAGLGAAALAGLLCFATTMRLDPAAWLSTRSPDARLAEQPALAYLLAHSAPTDRVLAGPTGGLYYRCARPPATRYTLLTPPSYRYQVDSDRQAIDADLAARTATYVVVGSDLPPAQAAEALFGHFPAGYRYEATRPLAFHGRPWPQHFFRREQP